jgi:hypothetical protein
VLTQPERFHTDHYDTNTLDNYVLAPAFGMAIPEATTTIAKILVVQWTWTVRLNSYKKSGPRNSGKRGSTAISSCLLFLLNTFTANNITLKYYGRNLYLFPNNHGEDLRGSASPGQQSLSAHIRAQRQQKAM